MKKRIMPKLALTQASDLQMLSEQPDAAINVSDIPECSMREQGQDERGVFYDGPPRRCTVRFEPDILLWFQRNSPAGQFNARINRVLREYMEQVRRGGQAGKTQQRS